MGNKIKKYFKLAIDEAIRKDKHARRGYRIGAVGIRNDGVIVVSRNLPNQCKHPLNHAETRLTKKLDLGGTVFVARVDRRGRLLNARPCEWCTRNLLSRRIKQCYYTISENEYGVLFT